MYPNSNYNPQYPNNQGQPGYPNPSNPIGFGGAPIGFNVAQPDYNQGAGYPPSYGGQQNPPYGVGGQPPNMGNAQPYQQQPPISGNPYGAPYQQQHQQPNMGYPNQHQPQNMGYPTPQQQPGMGYSAPQTAPGGHAPLPGQGYHPGPQQAGYQPGPQQAGYQPGPQQAGYQPGPQQAGYQPGTQPGCQASYPVSPPQTSGAYAPPGHAAPQQIGHAYPNITGSTPVASNAYQQISMDCIGSGGEIYRGTIKPFPNFNAEHDSNVLKKAMKGLGTDEKAIIECLGRRCLAQRLEIRKTYKTMFGKDLLDELKSELSGDFCRAVIESLYDQDYFDAYSLRKAMEGAGTREYILTEILTSRSNSQIENIKVLYKKWYNKDLEKDIVKETSGFYKRVLVSCLQANKKELTPDEIVRIRQHGPSSIVNVNQAKLEAQELYGAGEKKLGTDEACFIKIFAMRNKYQLRATFDEYQRIVGHDIFTAIDREMSGDLASALKAIAMQAVNSPLFFATKLHQAMKGAGTTDNTLIRILLTRSEIDLENIKAEFQRQFGKSLDNFVRGDTSGDYQKFLIRFVDGN